MPKQATIFIAPPGAGKGTQANKLAEALDFYHLESSKVIEDVFAESDPDDEEIKKEKENWSTGILVDPQKVTKWIGDKIKELSSEGRSIVFSGSPRTLLEAQEEVPLLENEFGRDNIKIFNINISEEESVRRNSNRRICSENRHPIPHTREYEGITACPWDGSEVVKRELDKPAIIRERLVEYRNRTLPVMQYFEQHDYKVVHIDGEQGIEEVHKAIMSNFEDDNNQE